MYEYILILLLFFGLRLVTVLEKSATGKSLGIDGVLFFLFTVAVLLLSGLRHGVGWDYYQYYWTVLLDLDTNITGRGEISTQGLVEVARKFSMPWIYFLINSAITVGLIHYTIYRYSRGKWISAYIFLCFPLFFLNSLSVVRFFSALAIIFFGFQFIEKRQIGRFMACVAIATTFHASAAIGVLLYLCSLVRFSYITVGAAFLIGLSAAGLINAYVASNFSQYSVYTDATYATEGTLAIYFFIAVLVYSLPVLDKLNSDSVSAACFNCFVVGVIIYVSFYGQGTMSHRLSLYGTFFSVLLIPRLNKIWFGKRAIYANITIYLSLSYGFFSIIQTGSETYLPYRWIFER